MAKKKNRYEFNIVDVILFLQKWKKHLIAITLAAAIISTIVSLVITPQFQSTLIFYPTTNNSISYALLTDNKSKEKDVLEFGEEEHAEQMLQLLQSDILRGQIISRFNLREHYEIDKDQAYPETALSKEYNRHISFRRTEFNSIEISVTDKDAQMAADIANTISRMLDSTKTNIQRRIALEALAIVEKQYKEKEHFVQSINDSLSILGKQGVYNYEEQSQAITEAYTKALVGNGTINPRLQSFITKFGELGSRQKFLYETLVLEAMQLSGLKSKYEKAKVDATEALSTQFIVSKAYKAEKKSYPVRWLIVVVSTVSAFFFGCLLLAFIERASQISADIRKNIEKEKGLGANL